MTWRLSLRYNEASTRRRTRGSLISTIVMPVIDSHEAPLGAFVTPGPSRTQCETISRQPVSIFAWPPVAARWKNSFVT